VGWRPATLDGLGGCLVVVMLNHAAHLAGWSSLTRPANASVPIDSRFAQQSMKDAGRSPC
jgi:hypothetical protein